MEDLIVFVARCQPFHVEHKRIIDTALEKGKHVLILLGSAGSARNPRNPFTFQERKKMILDCYGLDEFTKDRLPRIIVEPLYDKTYNDSAWIKQVQNIVNSTALKIANPNINTRIFSPNGVNDLKISLIGASKDKSSYYLKMFPQFNSINVEIKNQIHATAIREMYFEGTLQRYEVESSLLPHSVCDFLFGYFDESIQYQNLKDWVQYCKDYKKQWKDSPYPVKQVTVDSVVEQSGHVLLVKRKSNPGKGLWAIPGGHLEIDETILHGVIRELKEETKIKVPESVLIGSIVNKQVYDDPNRSTLGRVITHAYHIKLKGDLTLPKIKGSDDAEKAKWVPIGDLKEDQLFDDHYHILCDMLGI